MVQKSGVHQLRLVAYPIIYRVLYIPGGAGFLPSTVVLYYPILASLEIRTGEGNKREFKHNFLRKFAFCNNSCLMGSRTQTLKHTTTKIVHQEVVQDTQLLVFEATISVSSTYHPFTVRIFTNTFS